MKIKGEFSSDVWFHEKTAKAKLFLVERTYNLFRKVCMRQFN